MGMVIPEEYIIQKFYQHAGYPKYTKSTNTYTGGCPICREGKSWGRKSRLYYIPKDTAICCHNCGWYSNPVNWIIEVEKTTWDKIVSEVRERDYEYGMPPPEAERKVFESPELPADSINMFDHQQLSYYKDNKTVKDAANIIVNRKLNTAVNRPANIYLSLTDYTHKNRLILPFYNRLNKIMFYQSRGIYNDGKPKYLSRTGSDKSLFNFNNVRSGADQVFITEGPIDSFFIKDSVAVAGIQERSKQSLTTVQKNQLDQLFLMQSVWVLDSQWSDEASKQKSASLLKDNQCVFIWPRDIGRRFKDINEMCIHFNLNEISSQYILDNTYCGLKGTVKLNNIR
jgi:hypothetical protein